MSKENQVGGSHYASKKIDPFTFAMENKWDPMLFSILKYLTRYKDKGTPLQDLQKAMHIAEYRKKFPAPHYRDTKITMLEYCQANGLSEEVTSLLMFIDSAHGSVNPLALPVIMDCAIILIQKLHEQTASEIHLEALREKIVSGLP